MMKYLTANIEDKLSVWVGTTLALLVVGIVMLAIGGLFVLFGGLFLGAALTFAVLIGMAVNDGGLTDA